MTERIKGKLEACSQPAPNRYGILVNGEWYNGFGENPWKEYQDCLVEVFYTQVTKGNNIYRNVEKVVLFEEKSNDEHEEKTEATSKQQKTMKDVFIARSVALKVASEMIGSISGHDDETEYLKIMQRFAEFCENWLLRQ